MNLYYYTEDNGDGSCSVRWCTLENLPALYDAFENNPASYSGNDGVAESIMLPDGVTAGMLGLADWQFFNPEEDN